MNQWETISSNTILTTPYFAVNKEEVKDFADHNHDFYKIMTNGAVLIVPVKVDPSNEVKFIMIEQYRHAIGRSQVEFPAGKLDHIDEPPLNAAIRELKEETGYSPKWMKSVYTVFPDASKTTDKLFIFMALVEGEPEPQRMEAFERGAGLRVLELSLNQIYKMISNNDLTNASSMAALLAIAFRMNEDGSRADLLKE